LQQSEEKVRGRLLPAAVPEVGQEKGKQRVAVYVPPCTPTDPEAGQKAYSCVLRGMGKWQWGARRFSSASV